MDAECHFDDMALIAAVKYMMPTKGAKKVSASA